MKSRSATATSFPGRIGQNIHPEILLNSPRASRTFVQSQSVPVAGDA